MSKTIPDAVKREPFVRKLRAVIIRWLAISCLPEEDRGFAEHAAKGLSLPTDL